MNQTTIINSLIWIFTTFLMISIAISFISNIVFENSCIGMFSIINYTQLILLLPMIPSSISDNVILFIWKLNYWLFSFDFFYNFSNSQLIRPGFNFNYSQPNSYFKLLELNSGSTIVNLQGWAILFSILTTIYLLFIMVHNMWIKKFSNSWIVKSTKFTKLMSIRNMKYNYIFLSYILILLTSIYEIYRLEYSTIERASSLFFSLFFFAYSFLIFMLCARNFISSLDPSDLPKHIYLKLMFSNIKETTIAQTYWIKILIQRILLVFIVIFISDQKAYIKSGTFISIQLLFWCYSAIIRPFNNK